MRADARSHQPVFRTVQTPRSVCIAQAHAGRTIMDFALGKLLSRAFGRPSAAASPYEAAARTVPDVAQPAAWLAAEAGTGIESKFGPPNSIELPLPDERLRSTVSGPELDRFLYIGSTWAAVCSQYLPAK